MADMIAPPNEMGGRQKFDNEYPASGRASYMAGYWASPHNLQERAEVALRAAGLVGDRNVDRCRGALHSCRLHRRLSKEPLSHEMPMSLAPFAPRGTTVEIEQGSGFAPKFDEFGLIPAIATDARSGDVLMFAWMNARALAQTIETGWATYWSRSRESLWIKGETSSNRQRVIELRTDCDQDVVWVKVEVEGHGASCHTGHISCFYRSVPIGRPVSAKTRLEHREEPVFDPAEVYDPKPS